MWNIIWKCFLRGMDLGKGFGVGWMEERRGFGGFWEVQETTIKIKNFCWGGQVASFTSFLLSFDVVSLNLCDPLFSAPSFSESLFPSPINNPSAHSSSPLPANYKLQTPLSPTPTHSILSPSSFLPNPRRNCLLTILCCEIIYLKTLRVPTMNVMHIEEMI